MKGIIEIQDAKEVARTDNGTMFLGKYKHPRRVFMEDVVTVSEKDGKNIMTVHGNDDLSGEYEVVFK